MRRDEARGLFGERIEGLDAIVLSPRERATLARAATILHELRAMRGDDDSDETTDIALAAYVCDEMATAKTIGG